MANQTKVNTSKASLQELRTDLDHQLRIPDDLDWDYFLETAVRAKLASDQEGINKPGEAEGRTIAEIISDASSLQASEEE